MYTCIESPDDVFIQWQELPETWDPVMELFQIRFDLIDPPRLTLTDFHQAWDPMDDDTMELDYQEQRFDVEVTMEGKELLYLYRIAFGYLNQAPEVIYFLLWDDKTVTKLHVDTLSYHHNGYILRMVTRLELLTKLDKIYYEIVGVTPTGLIIALNQDDQDELTDEFQLVTDHKVELGKYYLDHLLALN